MPEIEINGNLRCHYDLVGEGRDLVFIHGEHHGTQYFEGQLPYFSRNYRCVTYDRRAHGRSSAPAYGYSLHNQTLDLQELIRALGFERPFVIAIAFGAVVALNLELEAPGSFSGLVMVGWSEIDGSRAYVAHFERQLPFVLPVLRDQGEQALVEYVLERGEELVPVLPRDPRLRRAYAEMFASRPVEAFEKRLELATSVPDLTRRIHETRLPILAIEGEHDPFPAAPALLTGLTNVTKETFAGSGRFVQWELPEEFNTRVEAFLATVPH